MWNSKLAAARDVFGPTSEVRATSATRWPLSPLIFAQNKSGV
jgi:hypothetical protein